MSLQVSPMAPIPTDTIRVAHAAFPKGTLCLQIRDTLGPLYEDAEFAALFSPTGQPAEAPARLALVLVLQFAEGLSDRQAADAVRGRIDWKYALALELTDPGFDASVLSEFRTRLIQGGAAHLLLEPLLRRLEERDLLKARGTQRTDSTHILAAIRTLNRLELVGESMRYALNRLAVAARSVAAGPYAAGLGRALQPPGGELPAPQSRHGSAATGYHHWSRWLCPAAGRVCPRGPSRNPRRPCGRGTAPNLAPAVLWRESPTPLAAGARCAARRTAHPFPLRSGRAL